MKKVSVIIPAYNEAEEIGVTLRAIRERFFCDELIVVDDGSEDETATLAKKWADTVISHPYNLGKGAAVQLGWQHARGDVIMLLDGDLRESAAEAEHLLPPLLADACDMTVAILPPPKQKAGMGLAKGLAHQGIKWLTGFEARAPLSGQRAMRRDLLAHLGKVDKGFGIEVGLTVDALRAGYRIHEVPVLFQHRETGNDWQGYAHRGKEFVAIGRTLCRKWWEGKAWR
ncbi:glycosyltransferase family 2 protein [Brevibacillus sp. FSL K6-0770]|uniref:Glycosyl transferase n=1 Tax=Brevibacillus parabrevis TaxID=54914 RepID=A0A4Y3PAV7_BREPA|nr:glycosyltransferase family 2 protein [Brevibacillus parabrevis]RNB93699.1 glycosyltransferase family 2 protein [Brevibacillus parabrevis]GEB31650.1 glycosyl transferase [Brevibacillus parabrevis]